MPMSLDEKKKGALMTMMKKRIGSGSSYDEMKESNIEGLYEKKMQDGAEIEHSQHGLDSAVDEIMSAFEAKNPATLKSALRSFITLIMHEYKE